MKAIIRAENLSKNFTRGSAKFYAVKNVNFTLNEGEFIHIIGRSGSGKSTFLNLLAGLLKPSEGKIFFEDKDINDFSDEEMSRYRNEIIGFVPQSLGTIPNLSVLENVCLPYYLFKRNESIYERASMLLDMMGIFYLKDDFPKNLSGGELKRVLLARSLINSPKVLILDEPTSDLDKKTTIEIMDLLKKINSKGTALIIVTHELDILKYGDILYQMDDGKLIKKGDRDEII